MLRTALRAGAIAIGMFTSLSLAHAQTTKPAEASQPSAPAQRSSPLDSNRPMQGGPNAAGSSAAPAFKMVVWFEKKNPVQTFKYELYDVRKGQYTPAVDKWLKKVAHDFPDYEVYVREIDLDKEKGKTEQEKVSSAVGKELMVTAVYFGGVPIDGIPGSYLPAVRSSSGPGFGFEIGAAETRAQIRPLPSMHPSPGSGGLSPWYLNPPPYSFPNPYPYPYPRPHP